MTSTFQFNKFGMKQDPRGAHVSMTLSGREMLGEVVGVIRDEVCGCFRLTVRFFNGEAWPIQPAATAVTVLERR